GRENGYAYASNDPINHHDPSGHMDIPKEELAPGEGGASTGRFKWLTRKKESKPGQKKPGGSPLYKAVRKHLYKAEVENPRQPKSSYYMTALRSAQSSFDKHPMDKMAAATADLLQNLYYHAKGISEKQLSTFNEVYGREYYLDNTSLTKDEFGLLRDTAIRVFKLESKKKEKEKEINIDETYHTFKDTNRNSSISLDDDMDF
ncbi:MAG: hypothetical protein AB2660_18510, partial [Candidatus Thiodiazotropha sp.]